MLSSPNFLTQEDLFLFSYSNIVGALLYTFREKLGFYDPLHLVQLSDKKTKPKQKTVLTL